MIVDEQAYSPEDTARAQPGADQNLFVITFWLAGQEYALPITNVIQIVEMVTITQLPRAPHSVQGIINVRGRVVPVVDLRLQFGLSFQPYNLNTPIILVDFRGWMLGLVADQVDEVLQIAVGEVDTGESILPAELDGREGPGDYLYGVGKIGRRMVPILELNAILTQVQQAQLLEAVAGAGFEE